MVQQQLINYVGKSLLLLGLIHCAVFSVQFLEMNTVTRATTIACPQPCNKSCWTLIARAWIVSTASGTAGRWAAAQEYTAEWARSSCVLKNSNATNCRQEATISPFRNLKWIAHAGSHTVEVIRLIACSLCNLGNGPCNMQEACSWKAKTWH